MANTALSANEIKFYLRNITQAETDWREAVCATDLTLNDEFNEVSAASKCGTQTLPGSRTISVEGAIFVLEDAATTGTLSEREIQAGYSARDTWEFKIADAYSGAQYQDKEGQGKFTNLSVSYNVDDLATANFTFQVTPETYVDNLAAL